MHHNSRQSSGSRGAKNAREKTYLRLPALLGEDRYRTMSCWLGYYFRVDQERPGCALSCVFLLVGLAVVGARYMDVTQLYQALIITNDVWSTDRAERECYMRPRASADQIYVFSVTKARELSALAVPLMNAKNLRICPNLKSLHANTKRWRTTSSSLSARWA